MEKETIVDQCQEYRKDYDNNPCLLYKIDYVYAKAERMQAEGDLDGAEKFLSVEIDSITDITTEPRTLLRLMDVRFQIHVL